MGRAHRREGSLPVALTRENDPRGLWIEALDFREKRAPSISGMRIS